MADPRLLIAIPSRSRAHKLRPLLKLLDTGDFKKHDKLIFVEPHQRADYEMFVSKSMLHTIPDNNRGLSYALSFAGAVAAQAGYDVVFKVDDDVRAFVRPGASVQVVVDDLLRDCLTAFATHPNLGGIGFPYSHQMFTTIRWAGMNQRLQTCYMLRPQYLLWESNKPKLDAWEDFSRTILIRADGRVTLRYGYAGISCEPVGKGSGGLQDFSRVELANIARQYLTGLLPDLQWRTVPKPWGQEPDFARTPSLRGKGLNLDALPSVLE